MKMIALQTIKAGGRFIPPLRADSLDASIHEFDVSDSAEAKALIASGAAREKGRADDATKVVVIASAENTAPRGPASGETREPSVGQVADAAKGKPAR